MKIKINNIKVRLIRLAAPLMASSISAIAFLGGCQTTAATTPSPAVLSKADTASLGAVKSAIETAMSRKNINFGAVDWAGSSTISILPARSSGPNGSPFNQQQFELPTLFDLMMDGNNCYLLQQGKDVKIPLSGVACQPLTAI